MAMSTLNAGAVPTNAFEALASVSTDLAQRAENHPQPGVIAEALDFTLPGRRQQRVMSLSVNRLAGGDLAFVISDVTERVRQRRELSRRERQLRSIFESVHNHMIVLLDETLRIQEFNASIKRLSGKGPEVVGEPMGVLFADTLDLPALRLATEEAGWVEIEEQMHGPSESTWWGDSILTRIPDNASNTIGFALVTREVTARREREMTLLDRAYRDTLTELPNRRRFDELFIEEFERAKRSGKPLSLCVMDIDHFKQVNDVHGHPVGDQVLTEVATRLSGSVRGADVVARVGGEEFALIAPGTDATGVIHVAERCRTAVAASLVGVSDQLSLPITVSVGTATFTDNLASASDLYSQADQALYFAKKMGRNRVETFIPAG
jgi:diguanylate cyclase (GGDEF)-like protein/PAS domain S-box-containing protein